MGDEPADNWQPTATLDTLKLRASLNRAVRQFFHERDVLELETPLIGPGNVPDPEVTGLTLASAGSDQASNDRYLQTSPELFMKRFVAAEHSSCFQLCKAFRLGERGRRHNPEFTLLEWYRVAFDTQALIREAVELIVHCRSALHAIAPERLPGPYQVVLTTYREVFKDTLGVDPLVAASARLIQLAEERGAPEVDRSGALSYLFAHEIERSFPEHQITVVDRFPADQAALARISTDSDGEAVAERFEVFVGSIELANGYGELTDPVEQARRFDRDTQQRNDMQAPDAGSQHHLLAALRYGLPDCSGVALGIDRLLMAFLGEEDLGSVVAFR